jgi:hypothetical protein
MYVGGALVGIDLLVGLSAHVHVATFDHVSVVGRQLRPGQKRSQFRNPYGLAFLPLLRKGARGAAE